MEKLSWLHKRLVRSVVKKMLNRADEDVEQEIYIRLWQKFPTYREQEKLGAWIRVVAENFCKDYLKSKSRKLLAASVGEEESGLADMAAADNPERAWLRKCRQRLILEAVDALPGDMRRAVVLVEFDGLSYDAAAKRLGINPGTLKSRLHNAKQNCMKSWRILSFDRCAGRPAATESAAAAEKAQTQNVCADGMTRGTTDGSGDFERGLTR